MKAFLVSDLLPLSTLRFDLIEMATQTEIKRPRVVAVMDVPAARYRRSRWKEGPFFFRKSGHCQSARGSK